MTFVLACLIVCLCSAPYATLTLQVIVFLASMIIRRRNKNKVLRNIKLDEEKAAAAAAVVADENNHTTRDSAEIPFGVRALEADWLKATTGGKVSVKLCVNDDASERSSVSVSSAASNGEDDSQDLKREEAQGKQPETADGSVTADEPATASEPDEPGLREPEIPEPAYLK